ncbi:MAG: FGGY-family carbohydrate kinase, partial [Roseiarcus sp.]
MDGPFLIGIDVGTTSVKAALFDATGRTRKDFSSAYATMRPAPGFVEQDPSDWTSRVFAGLNALAGDLPQGAVAGIGLCSQVNTHVFVDENGEALLPAITWQDGRCAEEARELDLLVATEDRLKWWGAPLPIDASHILSRMIWVKRSHPGIWSKTRWVMAPKDYCIFKLTGEAVADPMSAFGVVDHSLAYISQLIALVPGAAERLPLLRSLTSPIGRVRGGLPGAGLSMVTATMDAWAGMLGAGAVKDGDAAYLSGTSEVGAIVSRRRIPTPGVIAFPDCQGITIHAGPTQAGGASVAWLGDLLGRSAEDISALASVSDPARPAPTFLPHLQGERAPLWDIAARASFSGLDASTGPPEMARAVLEGVAYSVRLLFGALEKSSGCKATWLHHAGGGARSDVWCQIRADVLNCVIERKVGLDSGVIGAAMLAGVGTGVFASIGEAAATLVRRDRIFEPVATRRALYDEGFARYMDLYRRLKGFPQSSRE